MITSFSLNIAIFLVMSTRYWIYYKYPKRKSKYNKYRSLHTLQRLSIMGDLAMNIGYLDNVKNSTKVGIRSAAADASHSAQTKQPV